MQGVSSNKGARSSSGDGVGIGRERSPPGSRRLVSSIPSETVVKLSSFDDDSASGCRTSRAKGVNINSESDSRLVDFRLGDGPAMLHGSKVDIGAASKVGANWVRKLISKLTSLLQTGVSEEDLACLAGQVARSNLKAIHAFSRDCGYQKHPACTNRVCGHRSRFVALVRRRLPSQKYLEFLLDFDQFLNHVETGGPKLLIAIRDIEAKIKEHPEHREFQKLVNLYTSERGYLPSKGLDFSGCKEEIARVGLSPGQIRAKSHALQAQLARKGLRIGRFEDVVAWMAPAGRGGHPPVFTYIFCSISICIFAFMAGAYPLYMKFKGDQTVSLKCTDAGVCSPSQELAGWISINQGQNFVFDYLLLWGGRYTPALEHGQAWRWFTSPFIHQNFQHILANTILLTALAGYVEYHHGTWRTILVFFLTSLAGNFLSATFEDQCLLVVGASGAVFGFMGFYVADYIINFETVKRPIFRIVIVLGFALFFAFTIFGSQGDSYVSHFSHIGGFICGIFPSFLIIPNIKEQRCKAAGRLINILKIRCSKRTPKKTGWKSLCRSEIWEESIWSKHCYLFIRFFGFLVLAAMFLALPLYLYASRLSGIECSKGNYVEDTTSVHNITGT